MTSVGSSISEIDNLIKTRKSNFKYSLSDAILFLLYADREPIRGKIRQMKEVFLMLTEIMNYEKIEPVHFEKKFFGPYSDKVEFVISQLAFSNYVNVSGKKGKI